MIEQLLQQMCIRDRRGRELNENVLNVERSVSKLEQKRATSAMEEQQILDRLWENYELSHSAAQEQRIELKSVQKASRRIGELKRAISGLGAVSYTHLYIPFFRRLFKAIR